MAAPQPSIQITPINRSILFYTFRKFVTCAYVSFYSSRFESGSPVHAPFAVELNVRVHYAVNTARKMGAHHLWKCNAPRALLTRRALPMPCALLARRALPMPCALLVRHTRSVTGICRGSRRCKHAQILGRSLDLQGPLNQARPNLMKPMLMQIVVSDPPAVFRKGFVPCEGFRPAEVNRRAGKITPASASNTAPYSWPRRRPPPPASRCRLWRRRRRPPRGPGR